MHPGRTWVALPVAAALVCFCLPTTGRGAPAFSTVPPDQRGSILMERRGTHDGGNVRTSFWNFGMIGDFPPDPLHVDLHTFHSLEAPIETGMNNTNGITPFVLARVHDRFGGLLYIMETGYRERQAISPFTGQVMRFEPRPGYFQTDSTLNSTHSPAMSDLPATWPAAWPDKLSDPLDPGWPGSWNGFFGKLATADQESFTVMDDQAYDAWPDLVPDSLDATRRGLGLRLEVRGLQWRDALARDILFLHYDVTNEGTTSYDDQLIFGMYVGNNIGGQLLSCDGVFESDDDNAFWDRSDGRNLAYAWDNYGHGVDLSGPCGPTNFVGYGFLQTPGNPLDGLDDDRDGIIDEAMDGGPGLVLTDRAAIEAYVNTHYDRATFEQRFGPLTSRPAYVRSLWWTGDEDLDWTTNDDLGADGIPRTSDSGEGDGIPTAGERDFERTDLDESDQLGLTGFKMNRIRAGAGNPNPQVDNIVFFEDGQHWPQRLWEHFTDPDPAARFDAAFTANYNGAFLMACGPFRLGPGETQRFSVAIAEAPDLFWLRQTMSIAQLIHDGAYARLVSVPETSARPAGYVLRGNHPNPFHHATRIGFRLPEAAHVGACIYDLQGRVVGSGTHGVMGPGEHEILVDAPARGPGLYFYRLVFEDASSGTVRSTMSGRMIVLK